MVPQKSGATLLVATGDRVGARTPVDGVLAGTGDERLALYKLFDQLPGALLVPIIIASGALLVADREHAREAGLRGVQRQAVELVRVVILGPACLKVVDSHFLESPGELGHFNVPDVAQVDLSRRRLRQGLAG